MEGERRTSKDIKGLVRIEKDWLGHKKTKKDSKGQVRT